MWPIISAFLAVGLFTALFFGFRAIYREWRYKETHVKRYGCE